jgi:hypothetical protein
MNRTNFLLGTLALWMFGACAPARPAPIEPASASNPAADDHSAHREHAAGAKGDHGAGQGHGHGHGKSGGMMDGMCPMKVPGVAVSASDTEGGIAIVFTTATGDVNDLRARVRKMAEMHSHVGGMHGGGGMMKDAADGGTEDHGMMQGCMMGKAGGMHDATATVEDVEGGARLILSPKDAAHLDALRAHVRKCQQRMQSGECPMVGGHGAAAESAPHAH